MIFRILKKQQETTLILVLSATVMLGFLVLSVFFATNTFSSSDNEASSMHSEVPSLVKNATSKPSELAKRFAALNVFKHPAIVNKNATKKTRLRLKLLGVLDDESSSPVSVAIISGKKSSGGFSYKIGDDLPGGAKLVEVHPDHVILKNRGARESLHLSKKVLRPQEAQIQQ